MVGRDRGTGSEGERERERKRVRKRERMTGSDRDGVSDSGGGGVKGTAVVVVPRAGPRDATERGAYGHRGTEKRRRVRVFPRVSLD